MVVLLGAALGAQAGGCRADGPGARSLDPDDPRVYPRTALEAEWRWLATVVQIHHGTSVGYVGQGVPVLARVRFDLEQEPEPEGTQSDSPAARDGVLTARLTADRKTEPGRFRGLPGSRKPEPGKLRGALNKLRGLQKNRAKKSDPLGITIGTPAAAAYYRSAEDQTRMNPLLTQSATTLARRIRQREITSEQAVRAHIHRIRVVNPRLNLVVSDRFDAALDEARQADERLAVQGPDGLPPLHGVPCTIKEAFALSGMPNSAGLVSRRGVIAAQDATAVARLRAAGAIPLGVTNVSELCMWMESDNRVYGRSRNPYDSRRIVGGSSGGEGGIVGAGGSPFGLGSDIGGSIRMPAFFNGVFGHKPTGGLVPGTGQYPNAETGDAQLLRYVTTGPLCRRAADLWPLLTLLAGPDGQDAGCRELELGDPDAVDLQDLRVLDVPENGFSPVHPALRAAQQRAVTWLAGRGAHVVRARLPALSKSLFIWSSMLSAAPGPSYRELLADGGSFRLGRELLRALAGRSPFTVPSLGLALLEQVPGWLPAAAEKHVALGRALRAELVERIGPRGVMLYPPYPSPAPRHRRPLLPPVHWAYTAIMNVLELPVTQVPLGLDRRGLPLGVQVVGIHGHDHVTVAVARALERAFGGWVPPPRAG